jgi:predicted Zn finger-like uncharacterized protein
MLIICPHCATSYEVEPSSLGAAGRSVRCVRCQTVWFAETPEPVLENAAAEPAAATAAAAPAIVEKEPASAEDIAVAEPGLAGYPQSGSLAAVEEAIAEAERIVAETIDRPPEVDDRGPVDIIAAPPLVPPQEAESVSGTEPADSPAGARPFAHDGRDIENFVARRAQRMLTKKRSRVPATLLPAAILMLLTVVASLLLWRKDIVRIAPQTASLYAAIGMKVNLRGLTFANIKTTTETQDGVPVLVVEGQIVAEGRQLVEVPRLRFAIRNAAGHEIYSWTAIATRNALGPGEAIDFRSRLASPPAEGRDVAVRFFTRRDMVAGIR